LPTSLALVVLGTLVLFFCPAPGFLFCSASTHSPTTHSPTTHPNNTSPASGNILIAQRFFLMAKALPTTRQ